MSKPHVQLWLLNHNRPRMGLEALKSCLTQDYPNLEVILSDNSDSSPIDVSSLDPKSFRHVRRYGLRSEAHFAAVLREVNADYFALVHDDDILEPFFISRLVEALEHEPRLSCVIGNARLMIDDFKSVARFNNLAYPLLIEGGHTLFQRYFRFDYGSNPFPAAMYRGSYSSQMRADVSRAGKYSDSIFIEQTLQWGPILYLPEPVMFYRRHQTNDSDFSDSRQAKKLVNYTVDRGYYKSKRDFDPMVFRVWMLLLRARRHPQSVANHRRKLYGCLMSFMIWHPGFFVMLLLRKALGRMSRRQTGPGGPGPVMLGT